MAMAPLRETYFFFCIKFEWIRYSLTPESAPDFQYLSPDSSIIEQRDNLRDLGVILSSDLSFNLHIEKAVTTASQMVGWAMRSFRTRGSYILLTILKSLVQPHLDYCCQLWCPSTQYQINRIEKVQRSLVSRIGDGRLAGADYWQKLRNVSQVNVQMFLEHGSVAMVTIPKGNWQGVKQSNTLHC